MDAVQQNFTRYLVSPISILNFTLESDFLTKVKKLIFTDAYYHSMFEKMTLKEKKHMEKIGIHYKAWFKKDMPLG